MKKLLTMILILYVNFTYAQVYIGATYTSISHPSTLIHFEKTNNRGLLLPTVTTLPTSAENGTILLDAVNATQARVKYKKNNVWTDLSLNDGDATSTRNTKTESNQAKVIIGAENSTADGVLVLESTSKAIELPEVTTTDNIVNPAPGMMVYVYNPSIDKSMLAVFNGTKWTYWTATN